MLLTPVQNLCFVVIDFLKYSSTCPRFPGKSSYSAVVLNAIFPEAAGRELLLHHHSEAMDETLADAHDITWQEENADTLVMET